MKKTISEISSRLKIFSESFFFYPVILAGFFSLIVSRRPHVVFNPQFWAEDGRIWYADAYNHGIVYSLFTPEAGYFQTLSRLVAIFSQILPLEYAPLAFNLSAIFIQIAVAGFIVSSRYSHLVPNLNCRLLIVFLYIALPHSWETNANLTNAQWNLAILALLIILAAPSEKPGWKIFDLFAISLSALSGPSCLLLIPIAVLKFVIKRERRILWLLLILVAGGLVQSYGLLTTDRPTQAALGVGFSSFFRITGRHLFVSPIIGSRGFNVVYKFSLWNDLSIILVNLFGFLSIGYALLKSSIELRLFIFYSVLIFAGAIYSPAVTATPPQWEAMAANDTALRYWLIPSFCFLVTLIYLAFKAKIPVIRYMAAVLLFIAPVGIILDWRNPKFVDLEFSKHANAFREAPPGTEVTIRINPSWEMKLIKKPD